MTKSALTIIAMALLFASCGQQPNTINTDNQRGADATTNNVATQETAITIEKSASYDPKAAEDKLFTFIDAYGSTYDHVPFAAVVDHKTYVYVIKGVWDGDNMGRVDYAPEGDGVGVMSEDNQPIIPIEYDWIYNIDAVANGHVVVKKDNKFGLYNLDGKLILGVEWDAIYPGDQAGGVLAQVKKGTQYGWADATGKVSFDAKDGKWNTAPKGADLINNWKARKDADAICPMADASSRIAMLAPAYMVELGVFADVMRLDNYKLEERPASGGVQAFISTFAYVSETRDMTIYESNVVTTDNGGNVVGKHKINESCKDCNMIGCDDLEDIKMLGDGLLQVRSNEEISYGANAPSVYNAITTFQYYKIDKSGNVEKLATNRVFPCTQFVKMDESYLKGCYAKMTGKESDEMGMEVMVHKHVSIEALDYMRNEIFASYGYKFKNEKWQKAFGAQDWYQPTSDNVDAKLSDIDRHNVQFLLDMKKKMEGKEAEFTQESMTSYIAAG